MRTKLMFMTLAGSHLYGTSTPNSDRDERGVCFQPVETILGLRNFESKDGGWTDKTDRVIYGLRKFMLLAQDCNPNILELLFAPVQGETALYVSNEWRILRAARHEFLSSKKIADRFIGYAYSQFKKMETHRNWLLNPPAWPNPQDYGLTIIGGDQHWSDHGLKLLFDGAKRVYDNYTNWLKERNPARHETEVKNGFDTKNGMHLVRLLDQGIELLQTGELSLPRPNAKRLLEIRNGSMTFTEIEEYLAIGKATIDRLVEATNLQKEANFEAIEELYYELTNHYLSNRYDTDMEI